MTLTSDCGKINSSWADRTPSGVREHSGITSFALSDFLGVAPGAFSQLPVGTCRWPSGWRVRGACDGAGCCLPETVSAQALEPRVGSGPLSAPAERRFMESLDLLARGVEWPSVPSQGAGHSPRCDRGRFGEGSLGRVGPREKEADAGQGWGALTAVGTVLAWETQGGVGRAWTPRCLLRRGVCSKERQRGGNDSVLRCLPAAAGGGVRPAVGAGRVGRRPLWVPC